MSDSIKPMTVVVVAIMPDGNPRLRIEGRGSLGDLMLAAKTLELEAASEHGRMKMAAAVDARRRSIEVVPEGAVPPELLKKEA